MKVDEFIHNLAIRNARYDVLDNEIVVEWSNRLSYASFYILDTDVMTVRLRPCNKPTVIKSIEFTVNEIVINNLYHLKITQHNYKRLLSVKQC